MNRARGFVCVILSAIIYGLTPVLGRMTYDEGSTPVSLALFRALLALPFLALWASRHTRLHPRLGLPPQKARPILLLTLIGGAGTTLLLYSSYTHMSVGLATSLHFIYPIAVTLGECLFFRKPLYRSTGLALLFAVCGLFLLAEPGAVHPLGLTLALASGLTYAFYMLYLVHKQLDQFHPGLLTFHTCLGNAFWIACYGLISKQISWNLTAKGWILTLCVSLLTAFGGAALLQIGVRLVGASSAAIVSTFEPLISVILGMVLLQEGGSWKKWAGCGLIILSVLALTWLPLWQQKRSRKSNHPLDTHSPSTP